MGEKIITKHLGFVMIMTAHVVFTAPGATPNTGFIGESIKLNFLFSENLTGHRHFVIHRNISGGKKIAEYTEDKDVEIFEVFPQNKSVSWKIEKLQLNHSGLYWASFFKDSGPVVKSDRIQLSVTEKRENTTAPTVTPTNPGDKDSGSPSLGVTVLVVLPVVLLIGLLSYLICVIGTKARQQQPQQRDSNPTVLETVEVSVNVPEPSLIYSVLDFPKRASAVLEINPDDTEYAAVSYLPDKILA